MMKNTVNSVITVAVCLPASQIQVQPQYKSSLLKKRAHMRNTVLKADLTELLFFLRYHYTGMNAGMKRDSA